MKSKSIKIRAFKFMLLVCFAIASPLVNAQYCDSDGHFNQDIWIENVSVGSIDNTTFQEPDGYGDYTNMIATLPLNSQNDLKVVFGSFGGAFPMFADGWIDFNGNDIFEANEKVLEENTSGEASTLFTVPGNAVKGKTRMRIIINWDFAVDDPCTTNLDFGEAEDYSIDLYEVSTPPVVNFNSDVTNGCSGSLDVRFFDKSSEAPTSWTWDFGDGNSSSDRNPSHVYSAAGSYDVKLVACNSFGCDSSEVASYIVITDDGAIAANCTPTTSQPGFGVGVFEFSFNTINNSTTSNEESYHDYGCTMKTIGTAGMSYNMSVTTNDAEDESVRVWIDYNNDGSFSDATELVLSSDNTFQNHSASVTLPQTAVTDQYLRVRVMADYWDAAKPSSCGSPLYGETEDYAILIEPDTVPPVASFNVNHTVSCNGMVEFTDLSSRAPSSWIWTFGDGDSSTSQNPSHTYDSSGVYTVSLIACNAFGCDTSTQTDLINVQLGGGPIAAACIPATLNGDNGFGITNVTFNDFDNTSSDASVGYEDFTCNITTVVQEGKNYTIYLVTDKPTAHNSRVWIDYNNDGSFDDVDELVFAANSKLSTQGQISIPSGTVQNTPLRMRVSADFDGVAAPTSCADLQFGQAEDYTIVIEPNTEKPEADFTVDKNVTCDGTVSFTDQSVSLPTGWVWDFGDGTSAGDQNPKHTYAADGFYTVSLIASNAFGEDTIIKTDLIEVILGNQPIDANCYPATLGYCCGYGITFFELLDISNTSQDGEAGYEDFTCGQTTTLKEGKNVDVTIYTSNNNPQDTRIWIDYNNDGDFDNVNELAFSSDNELNPTGSINIPVGKLLNTPLRLRISSDFAGSNPLPCEDLTNGQVEDYMVMLEENVEPPIADFTADVLETCDGVISFTDLSENGPTSWTWDFGDGNNSNDQNPIHTYSTTGIFSVTLTATNAFGNDIAFMSDYINVLSVSGGADPISCEPSTDFPGNDGGINQVVFNTIDHVTPVDEGYMDYSCEFITSVIAGQVIPIEIGTNQFYEEDVRVWLDINGDGELDQATELIFESDQDFTHQGEVQIPTNITTGKTLRLRVFSDGSGGGPGGGFYFPCSNPQVGEVADYGLIAEASTIPPVADFETLDSISCTGIVRFNDISTLGPESWSWDFGDGNTSIEQNPTHTYSTTGFFSVKLVVSNSFGADSITRFNYINVTEVGNSMQPASCYPGTMNDPQGFEVGISSVEFNTINMESEFSEDYQDFTCSGRTNVQVNETYTLSVFTNEQFEETAAAWIDFNNNGEFEGTEQVMYSENMFEVHEVDVTIPSSAVLETPLRMRIGSDAGGGPGGGVFVEACTDLQWGHFEDYSVTVYPSNAPPVAGIGLSIADMCQGVIEYFDQSTLGPETWEWDFGDGSGKSFNQDGFYKYEEPGTYTITLKVTSIFGESTITQPVTIESVNASINSGLYAEVGVLVTFQNSSLGGDTYLWEFGDGSTDSAKIGAHQFNAVGKYVVSLTVSSSNSGCMDIDAKEINVVDVIPSGIASVENQFEVYPNPATDNIQLKGNNIVGGLLTVYDNVGKEVHSSQINQSLHVVNTSAFADGVYIIKVRKSSEVLIKKFIKK